MATERGNEMLDVCFYFQVHQPWRLRPYRFLEVGRSHDYFDEEKNSKILRKVAEKCYLPMNNLLQDLLREHKGRFKVAFSISGTAMDQMERYAPEVLASFKRLFSSGQGREVELLSETSHHSLASVHSPTEFAAQVALHREKAVRLLGVEPSRVFRNTELIASNAIAAQVAKLGYGAMLMEGADHVLRWRSPLFKYRVKGAPPSFVALMKNYRLSDDIAFRFSDRGWAQWPLTSEKFNEWVRMLGEENPVAARGGTPFLGLFMDYETFGEHQWASTGIFDFMRALPGRLLRDDGQGAGVRFVTPTEAMEEGRARVESAPEPMFEINAPEPFSWADVERDLSAWQGNPIQDAALRACYRLERAALDEGGETLETWRRLTTSDHFYYMCTKHFADGDVHKYFNPHETPYDAHIIYMNVIADLERRLSASAGAVA